MAKPPEKLAQSLEKLRELHGRGAVAIRSRDLSRTHRERLLRSGFLREVMKGWYIASRPEEAAGESTAWYTSFWRFCADYLGERLGKDWCLSPEQSLSLHAENWTVPKRLLIRTIKARNNVTQLPYGTSLLDIRASVPDEESIVDKNGLRLFSLPAALISCAPGYFSQNPTDTRAALFLVRDGSEVLGQLLEGGHSTVAGRLAGAFRNIGRDRIADEILSTMRTAGYDVRESDPFEKNIAIAPPAHQESPYANRIRLMWEEMRGTVIDLFPTAPDLATNAERYLKEVEDNYANDAYHSLSIEGYQVGPELIERVRTGAWRPDKNRSDREDLNALAARGYWQAFQAVRESIRKVLRGSSPGEVADEDHRTWFREMFAPSVTAGLVRPSDLAGYRSGSVYIRQSMLVPPSPDAVRDSIPAFFDLLKVETESSVRVVLGHFIFVYIHPYMDGNGRMGRFLMNVMLAGGGYPWTIISLEERDAYMTALEAASVDQDIRPFTSLLSRLVNAGIENKEALP